MRVRCGSRNLPYLMRRTRWRHTLPERDFDSSCSRHSRRATRRKTHIAMSIIILLSLTCLLAVDVVLSAPVESHRLERNWKHCDHLCTDIARSPVCAVDDNGVTKTFENKCEIEKAICLKSGYYAVIKDGECL